MEQSSVSVMQLPAAAKRFARRLLTIGENRLELLVVEVQEERERLLHNFLLALGAATLGLLAGLTLTAAIVVLLWAWSPLAVLLALTAFYGITAAYLCRRLIDRLRDAPAFCATLDQLKKDHACLEKNLA